jgi:hypothetical protein
MQASQGLAAVVNLSFGAALALGLVSTWMLFAFTMLMGASNVMDRPRASPPRSSWCRASSSVKAVSLNTIGFSMARVLGPMLAGYLIAAFGGAGTFFLQGVLYAASGLMVFFVVFPPRVAPAEQKSPWHDMAQACASRCRIRARAVLLAVGFLPFFLLIPVFGTLYPIYAKDVFAAGPTGPRPAADRGGRGGTLGGFIANALGRAERQGLIQSVWIVVMAGAHHRRRAQPVAAARHGAQRDRRRGRDGARLEQHGDAADVGAAERCAAASPAC